MRKAFVHLEVASKGEGAVPVAPFILLFRRRHCSLSVSGSVQLWARRFQWIEEHVETEVFTSTSFISSSST